MTNAISQYSLGEELANAISHGLGAILSVIGLTFLVTYAAYNQTATHVTSFAIYGASLVILFMASTLYHAVLNEKAKFILKRIDHCAIYLLIAGSYTPLMLITVPGVVGYTMLSIIWSCAIIGIVFKIKFAGKYQKISLATYLIMGFAALAIIKPLYQQLPTGGLVLLVAGGLTYAIGVIFYAMKSVPYMHALWHLFVLAAAICHFFMMALYV
ncbi:PAQR family membrane homeostasis protein TrhA [Thalassotalea agarivorans]|uniref:Hemolysin III n=1 Tax=Thalassotalea agarivorans TaxID=349064 RepID=A0A1H9Z7C9_THASX|nr:hemolysin III family protein [Thalassotalea agarivorans]SES77482.1 hemolysin III [Thalassotalea agarivorans]